MIKYVTGQLRIQNILIEGLGYQIRNARPIEIQLANQKLSLEEGFSLEDQASTVERSKTAASDGIRKLGVWEEITLSCSNEESGSRLYFRLPS